MIVISYLDNNITLQSTQVAGLLTNVEDLIQI